MSVCPCGCPDPVREGNTYAGKGCAFRLHARERGIAGGKRSAEVRKRRRDDAYRARLNVDIRRALLASDSRVLFGDADVAALVAVMVPIARAEYARGYNSGQMAKKQAQRRQRRTAA